MANLRQLSTAEQSLSGALSSSRLNAQAPEFVPRLLTPSVQAFRAPATASFQYLPVCYEENYAVSDPNDSESAERDGLSEDIIQRVTKQVEYYFSDANLATTEHLVRFIGKDPEGYVPISVIAAFKKIKTLVNSTSLLATALRASSKLAVSDDGNKVKRIQPITDADLEELQSRIIVAENLPDDHCYRNLLKIFSGVGSVKTIRTCYPPTHNSTTSAASRSGKIDPFLCNKLHAFVEFETIKDAKKAVADLNGGKNWRNGLRVRLLSSCITRYGLDASMSNQTSHDCAQSLDPLNNAEKVDRDARHGCSRGHGPHARGRGLYHPVTNLPVGARLPLGPRMPDGTKGFNMGRGRLIAEGSLCFHEI